MFTEKPIRVRCLLSQVTETKRISEHRQSKRAEEEGSGDDMPGPEKGRQLLSAHWCYERTQLALREHNLVFRSGNMIMSVVSQETDARSSNLACRPFQNDS